jgi:pimeloyl-ACP methyl ester carboxylesterase
MIVMRSEHDARPDLSKDEIEKELRETLFASPLPSALADQAYPRYQPDQDFDLEPQALPRTLVLQGDMDARSSYEGARRRSELLEREAPITFYRIPGGPHFLLLAVPECFTPIVRNFVNGQEVAGAPCAVKLGLRF